MLFKVSDMPGLVILEIQFYTNEIQFYTNKSSKRLDSIEKIWVLPEDWTLMFITDFLYLANTL
jgi:hypothetical protein